MRASFDSFVSTGDATLYATNVKCVQMVISSHLFKGHKLVASNLRIDDSEYSNSGMHFQCGKRRNSFLQVFENVSMKR